MYLTCTIHPFLFITSSQKCTHRIEYCKHHYSHICKDCEPHICNSKCSENQAHALYCESKYNILIYDSETFLRNSDCLNNLQRIIIHQDNICCLNCRIGSHCPHRNTDIRSSKNRCIVNAVSDKCQGLPSPASQPEVFLPAPPYLQEAVRYEPHQYQDLLPPGLPPVSHLPST